MGDHPLQKIAISGPTLASLIQRFSFSSGAVDGLLFGHVTHIAPSNLSDDMPSSTASDSSPLVATITGFICSGTVNSFYDSAGRVDAPALTRLLGSDSDEHRSLIGWFSGRRRTQLRPSLREFSVTASLSSKTDLSFPVRNAPIATNLAPCVFVLFGSPFQDQTIHTHEYRAHQFRTSAQSFESISIDIVNIGPAFRGHYGSFSPNSPFPLMHCEMRTSPMSEDRDDESLGQRKRVSKIQRELDMCAEGLEVGDLRRLVGPQAVNYTAGVEDLYEKMLTKIENLARLVEKSSAKVLEQENHNRNLRLKVARSAGLE
ncbi:FAM175 family [Parasponia andersonii]|uniref:FAM175 family n=1 Tax=Parasponia andersonii TaxID=3476 RepID=A0A2P5B159_PARAD|nr:FAM175 family [Parasponia andersonii]